MALTRPVIIPPWAETGDKSAQPSDSDIQAGWPLTTTPPSRQKFNWLLNFLGNGVRYLTARGVADWNSGETYAKNSACIGDDGRLYQSLQASNLNNTPSTSSSYWARIGTPVGFAGYHTGSTAPADWVEENGGTIGSASSGATTRANADTSALFAHLWGNYDNTALVIQASDGSPSTRGVSAAADFAANKRMPLFDMRGEFARGWDNSRGIDTGRALGSSQSSSNLSHSHTGSNDTVAGHTHTGSTDTNSGHTHTGTTDSSGSHTHQRNADGFQEAANVDTNGTIAGNYSPGSNYLKNYTDTGSAGAHTHTFTSANGGSHSHTVSTTSAGSHSHAVTINADGSTESRPRNIARLAIIKL